MTGRHSAAESHAGPAFAGRVAHRPSVRDRPNRTLRRRARSCADDDRRSPVQGSRRATPNASPPAQPEAGHTGRCGRATHSRPGDEEREAQPGGASGKGAHRHPSCEDRHGVRGRKGRHSAPSRKRPRHAEVSRCYTKVSARGGQIALQAACEPRFRTRERTPATARTAGGRAEQSRVAQAGSDHPYGRDRDRGSSGGRAGGDRPFGRRAGPARCCITVASALGDGNQHGLQP